MSDWVQLRGVRRARSENVRNAQAFLLIDVITAVVWVVIEIIRTAAGRSGPWAEASLSRGEIRIGKRSLPFGEITRAKIDESEIEADVVVIRFGKPGTLEFAATVRDDDDLAPEGSRELLARVFERSHIDIPRDKFDPKGRFARSGSPYNITREEAVAIALDPPHADDELPIIRHVRFD